MKDKRLQGSGILVCCVLWGICMSCTGCKSGGAYIENGPPIPRELQMTTLPAYRIEPPDILIIRTMNVVPKPPYRVQPLDALYIQASNTLPDKPIGGAYGVEPDGNVNLGLTYGTFRVAGMTIAEAEAGLQKHLESTLKQPRVQVSLASSRGLQQIQGDHLVRQDGTIGLGVYGSVYITGMTLEEARQVIEQHLSKSLLAPEISLDVYSYNSKWYYIIADRAGYGQTVLRLPITGRDTVLDAISQMYGTTYFSSNKHMWVARPNGDNPNCEQVFPVDWPALTRGGNPATNYQLLPGDRLFVQSNPLVLANNRLTQFLAPVQNLLGFTLLGAAATQSVESTNLLFKTGSTGTGFTGIGR